MKTLLNGNGNSNLSQLLKVINFLYPTPISVIFAFSFFSNLNNSGFTLYLGPRGPSGIIPKDNLRL